MLVLPDLTNVYELCSKQARWKDFLMELDLEMVYKMGRSNVVADAIVQKTELAAITTSQMDVMANIRAGLNVDPMARSLKKLV
ncbi:hypothetical protein V2J09_004227 [Rumex salicifolius]